MAQSKEVYTAILLMLLPLVLASCQPRITEQGKRQLIDAANLLQQGSDAQAVVQLERFIDAFTRSYEVAEANYLLGISRVRTNQFAGAEENFDSALARADVPILEHYVRLSLANLAFERRDYVRAGKYYGRYLDRLPRREPFHLAHFRYGLSLQALGQWKQADVQFSRVLYLFPRADILTGVQERFGKTHYAIELGRFSSFDSAAEQRQQFADLDIPLPRVRRTSDGWSYVNLYGSFSKLAQAQQVLEQIKPRIQQARIVP